MKVRTFISGLIFLLPVLVMSCVAADPGTPEGGEDVYPLDTPELRLTELQSENEVLKRENLSLRRVQEDQKKQHAEEIKTLREEAEKYKRVLASMEESYKKLKQSDADGEEIASGNIAPETIAREPENELQLNAILTPTGSGALTQATLDKKGGATLKTPAGKTPLRTSTAKSYTDDSISPPALPIKTQSVPASKKLYNDGYTNFLNKKYDAAIQDFLNFIRRYPQEDYADNALFWLAMSYWQTGNTAFADRYFREILTKYEHGTPDKGYKTADAIFMLGRIYTSRKDPDKARFYYQRTASLYPGSIAAGLAKAELGADDSADK